MGAGVNGMTGSPAQGSFTQQVSNYSYKYYLYVHTGMTKPFK